jgi:hypothetical protein
VKLQARSFLGKRMLNLVVETEEESLMIDEYLGSKVQDSSGYISSVIGQVKLSDGYGQHYIALESLEEVNAKKKPARLLAVEILHGISMRCLTCAPDDIQKIHESALTTAIEMLRTGQL